MSKPEVRVDQSKKCVACGKFGVLVNPFNGKSGVICPDCFLDRMEEMLIVSEAQDILETGEMYPDDK